MLVTFEGLDGSGKSTLLAAVSRELTARGIPCGEVPELSDTESGDRLRSILREDKFLMPGEGSNPITRTLEIVADLYALDASRIRPMRSQGLVVLKDRHIDTVFSCQMPMLESGGFASDSAFGWLATSLSLLSAQPDLTCLVEASEATRVARIVSRRRELQEAAANVVSAEDLKVFQERERWYRRLAALNADRMLSVENEEGEPSLIARAIADRIQTKMMRTEPASERDRLAPSFSQCRSDGIIDLRAVTCLVVAGT